MKSKSIYIVIIFLIISVISGILANDLIIGGTTLFTGLLAAYYAVMGKKINYAFAFINYLLMAYTSLKNNLYGVFFMYAFICTFLQIYSFIKWKNNMDKNNSVIIRQFTLKNSIIIVSTCIIGSFLLGYLLNLIPNQNLAFLDAASNSINICGIILMMLRFKECWWVWLANNIIDLVIWIIVVFNKGEGSTMMLLVSIGYLLLNIYGVIKWKVEDKKENLSYD